MPRERNWNGSCNFGVINTKLVELPFFRIVPFKNENFFFLLEWVI